MTSAKYVSLMIAGVASILFSSATMALPISVSQDGADVTVSYDVVGQTVSFDYLFATGDAATASAWIGTTMDALSIQFGGKNDELVDSLDPTSTNSSNVNGVWTGYRDKQSGQGCFPGTFDAACYTHLATGVGGSGSETVIAANTDYLFEFDVIFKAGVDVADVLAGDHSIKFLSLTEKCNNGNGCKWSTGVQLSQSGGFYPNPDPDPDPDPDPGPNPVPVPGTVALFGLGLLGLRSARRRR